LVLRVWQRLFVGKDSDEKPSPDAWEIISVEGSDGCNGYLPPLPSPDAGEIPVPRSVKGSDDGYPPKRQVEWAGWLADLQKEPLKLLERQSVPSMQE